MSESDLLYKVVVNHEEQHSIWPADRQTPVGWSEVGVTGSREVCLSHIREVWPDITPLSVRQASLERAEA
ncbi:MbtH family protein [Kitasatospora brasiliensis]|uniref:MbtH family protein n=1 Tax=Kitasatospora brasiliensis TaxID=3058040 RepID=UPI0029304814|nr:MbtH family protein [Kitasatospora sp. K002]